MTDATEITNRMRSLLRCEQGAMADFLVALAEVIDQKLWRELGYSSPFYYVRREFKLCAGAAQNRITAAELILRVPEIEPALRSGQLYLSTVTVIAKVLTSENKDEVLPRFFDLSRREAEQVAVSIRPAEVIPVRDVVTPIRPAASPGRAVAPANTLPMAATSNSPAADAGSTALAFHMDETAAPVRVGAGAAGAGALQVHLDEPAAPVRVAAPAFQLAPEPPRDEIEPLDAKLSRLHITVDDELLQLLEASKDAFSHSFPSGRAADVIKHGLRVALAQHDKRLGLVEKPLKAPRPSRTNHIPAHVKREVLRRAGGRRCEWILPSGERCDCRRTLQFDHIKALALGGKSTLENVRLLCRSHNLLAARQVFGDALMDRYAPGRSPARR
jgi:5-methylcytosine-specific restriction endonuclease McrA